MYKSLKKKQFQNMLNIIHIYIYMHYIFKQFFSRKNEVRQIYNIIYNIALRGTRTLTHKALVPKTNVYTNFTRRAIFNFKKNILLIYNIYRLYTRFYIVKNKLK